MCQVVYNTLHSCTSIPWSDDSSQIWGACLSAQSTGTVFEFIGGHLCLDFTNTVGGLRGSVAHEHLASYADLVRWSVAAGILTEQDQATLFQSAGEAPDQAVAVLRRAHMLREAMYSIFSASTAADQPAGESLDTLNLELRHTMSEARISASPSGLAWAWDGDSVGMDRMLGPIARSAAELLTLPDRELVRMCASESCGWLFVDYTKNHRRRWCTMDGCGNRARVRRHRQRTHAEVQDAPDAALDAR